MILDLEKFITAEKPFWNELEKLLELMERRIELQLDLNGLQRLHYLYQRASADLARLSTFSSEPSTRRYLENLVSRAYGEVHGSRARSRRLNFRQWVTETFPQAFRRHLGAFAISVLTMVVGSLLGMALLLIAPDSKSELLPFGHLHGDPSERVDKEEAELNDRMAGSRATFSSMLMTHNIKVSILTLALGVSWGLGTLVMLFYNGVILGMVALDYVLAGESVFLVGWLLPHGATEIPAILLAGQGGLILGSAMIGWGQSKTLRQRLRIIGSDLVTLICGAAFLLVWAGGVEAFLSQYHEPVIPYALKIGFGLLELILLGGYLWKSGSRSNHAAGAAMAVQA